jgi:hypothetical protein
VQGRAVDLVKALKTQNLDVHKKWPHPAAFFSHATEAAEQHQQFEPPLKTLQQGITFVVPVEPFEGVGNVLISRPSTEALGSPRLSTGPGLSVIGAGAFFWPMY